MKSNIVLSVFLLSFFMFTPTLEWDKSTLSQQEQQSQPLVVINEIGWSGTLASTADEWIELRNNSSTALDLTGWTLTWGREEDPWVIRFTDTEESNSKEVRSSVLASRGFYLLERSDDEVIRDIRADLIYSGSLRNTGEIIVLRNSDGDIIDTANSEGGEWPAGSTSQNEISYASMERINPTLHDSSDNWLSNNGVLKNGRDADGNLVNGTPKAENSQKNTE